MKTERMVFLLVCLVLLGPALPGCTDPEDPLERYVLFMEAGLKILEENKTDPAAAGKALQKFILRKQTPVLKLIGDLNAFDLKNDQEVLPEMREKLASLSDRLTGLLHESPTLFLNEDVTEALKDFLPLEE